MSKLSPVCEVGPRRPAGVSPVLVSTTRLVPTVITDGLGVGLPVWKSLNGTPVEVVGRPGPGKALLFERALIEMVGGGTDGDTDSNLSFRYKAGAGDDVSQAQDDMINDITASGTIMTVERIGGETQVQTLGYLQEDKAIELYAASNLAASAGDRYMVVTVLYRIVSVRY